MSHANKNRKKPGIAILRKKYIDLKQRLLQETKKGIKQRERDQFKEHKTVNIYAPIVGTPKCIKQILIIHKEKLAVTQKQQGTLTPPLTSKIDDPDRKSIKNTNLNHILNHMDYVYTWNSPYKINRIHIFQLHMEYSVGKISCEATKESQQIQES